MEPLKIGNIILPHRAVFGPMAGFTDAPCRRLMAQHGAGFTVSEMVSSRALVYGDHKTVSLLKAEPNGAPYGVQIFGEVPEIMGEATAAIEQYEFDFVDINMGCPAQNRFRRRRQQADAGPGPLRAHRGAGCGKYKTACHRENAQGLGCRPHHCSGVCQGL